MRKYIFEVVVFTGNDEFWDDIERDESTTGCDQVLELVRAELFNVTDAADIKLTNFIDKE